MTDGEAVELACEAANMVADRGMQRHGLAVALLCSQLADARAELARERERGDRAERDAANLHRLACGAIWQGYDTTRVPSAAEIFTDCQDAWTEDPPEVVKTGIFVFLANDPQAGQKGGGE
jgi:hypothetical protein